MKDTNQVLRYLESMGCQELPPKLEKYILVKSKVDWLAFIAGLERNQHLKEKIGSDYSKLGLKSISKDGIRATIVDKQKRMLRNYLRLCLVAGINLYQIKESEAFSKSINGKELQTTFSKFRDKLISTSKSK